LVEQAERAAKRNDLSIVASFVEFNEKTGSDELHKVKQILLEKMEGE
jgi:hypothetical protein